MKTSVPCKQAKCNFNYNISCHLLLFQWSFMQYFLVDSWWHSINPIQNGLFGAVHGIVGAKRPLSLKSVKHTLQWWNLDSYTLPNENQKKIWVTRQIPWVLLTPAIFDRKSATFAISRNIDRGCILIHNFSFF